MNYAIKYPGALGALSLSQVRMKLMGGQVEDFKDLYKTDPTVWAGTLSGLKAVRDLREVQLLSKVVSELNKDRIPQAVDLKTHRVREALAAKKTGGSWEKGALVSLLLAGVGPGVHGHLHAGWCSGPLSGTRRSPCPGGSSNRRHAT